MGVAGGRSSFGMTPRGVGITVKGQKSYTKQTGTCIVLYTNFDGDGCMYRTWYSLAFFVF